MFASYDLRLGHEVCSSSCPSICSQIASGGAFGSVCFIPSRPDVECQQEYSWSRLSKRSPAPSDRLAQALRPFREWATNDASHRKRHQRNPQPQSQEGSRTLDAIRKTQFCHNKRSRNRLRFRFRCARLGSVVRTPNADNVVAGLHWVIENCRSFDGRRSPFVSHPRSIRVPVACRSSPAEALETVPVRLCPRSTPSGMFGRDDKRCASERKESGWRVLLALNAQPADGTPTTSSRSPALMSSGAFSRDTHFDTFQTIRLPGQQGPRPAPAKTLMTLTNCSSWIAKDHRA